VLSLLSTAIIVDMFSMYLGVIREKNQGGPSGIPFLPWLVYVFLTEWFHQAFIFRSPNQAMCALTLFHVVCQYLVPLAWRFGIKSRCRNGSVACGQIRVSGRDTFDYIQGDRCATIYAELLQGPVERRICVWSIRRWQPPHDAIEMTQQEKDVILSCLREYFDIRRIKYDLLEGDPSPIDR
jgi:hypothetical protein